MPGVACVTEFRTFSLAVSGRRGSAGLVGGRPALPAVAGGRAVQWRPLSMVFWWGSPAVPVRRRMALSGESWDRAQGYLFISLPGHIAEFL